MQELIYNQNHIPKDKWRYGLRASADTGCGWIATYNALCLLGYKVNIEKLISGFEWQVPLVHGNAGTTFFGPALKLRQLGFPVTLVADPKKFDEAAKTSDVCILFFRWRRGIRFGAHFAALQHTQEGFVGYNTYRDSLGPDRLGRSLPQFLKQNRYFGALLITVQKRK